MPDWPIDQNGTVVETIGADTGTGATTGGRGLIVTAGAANADDGAWAVLSSSTAKDADGFYLIVQTELAATASDFLLSIGIGASGAEKKILEHILISRSNDAGGVHNGIAHYFPIPIPAGTRVAAKVRGSTASSILYVEMLLVSMQDFGAHGGLGRVTQYGANTTDSGGLSIDPGGTAHTLAWTEITSSASAPGKLLWVAIGNQLNTGRVYMQWLLTIARGASGAEANNVLVDGLHFVSLAGNDLINPTFFGPFPCEINSGDRLAAGARCSSNAATDRLFDIVIYTME